MARFKNWQNYVSDEGDYAMPRHLYETLNDLMKQCLDYGVMAVQDKDRLRAYKEAVKAAFKKRWNDLAGSLEYFGIVEPCGCLNGQFCRDCGGSRFRLNESLNPDQVREVAVFIAKDADPKVAQKLLEKLPDTQPLGE